MEKRKFGVWSRESGVRRQILFDSRLSTVLFSVCDRAGLDGDELPAPFALSIDVDGGVLAVYVAPAVAPARRVATREHGGLAIDAHADVVARHLRDRQLTRLHVGDELRLVVAFKRI